MYFDPFLWEEPNFIEWRIGTLSIKLPFLDFGDSKRLTNKSKIFKDLVVASYRQTDQEWTVTFNNIPKEGDLPATNMLKQVKDAFKYFAGYMSILILKDGTRYIGIAKNLILGELDNCKMTIQFDFEIVDTIYPEGRMKIS